MSNQSVYWFGRFELRPAERRLLRQGMVVEIGDRAFDVLVALVENRGQVVTKSRLLDLVWPDMAVEERWLSGPWAESIHTCSASSTWTTSARMS